MVHLGKKIKTEMKILVFKSNQKFPGYNPQKQS